MYIILIKKLKYGTKEMMKVFSIMAIGLSLIIAIIIIKYKPSYEVKVEGETIGYIENKKEFEDLIEEKILNQQGNNIDFVTLACKPEYELKLMSKQQETNEDEVIEQLKNNAEITYKYFAVTLDDQVKSYVESIEEASKIVEDIKNEYEKELDLNLQVIEKYTNNLEEISIESLEVAETNLEQAVNIIIEENGATKINGIKIASMPIDSSVNTIISSRFGELSSIRSSAHKGLDIACVAGTDIKAIAAGTIIYSGYDTTGLGNVVKIDHGNGIETWYGHCSKLYVHKGQTVEAGDIISAVGSTGNSTGPHLHIEIRQNGKPINPQLYIYN